MPSPSVRALVAVACLVLAVPRLAGAQTTTASEAPAAGRIEVAVTDGAGTVVPNVRITVSGAARASATTDASGTARLTDLPTGLYDLSIHRPGAPPLTMSRVAVKANEGVSARLTLRAGSATAVFADAANGTMTAEWRPAASSDFHADDLAAIPTSRDPWALLPYVPGIVLDRVNVGGTDAQQPSLLVKGASARETVWTLDGLPITDMSALGHSPAYYDFGALRRVEVTTGGAAVTRATVGAQIDLGLQRRIDAFAGTGRIYLSGGPLQGDNVSGELAGRPPTVRRLGSVVDAGLELGAPLASDRIFGWFAYGVSGPRLDVLSLDPATNVYSAFARDNTTVHNAAASATLRLSPRTHASANYLLSAKTRSGRDAGPTRPVETTLNQSGPVHVLGFELRRAVSDAFLLNARVGRVQHQLTLEPAGGMDTVAFIDDAGVWRNTFRADTARRPQTTVLADGRWQLAGQDLVFGAGWRRAAVDALSVWPGGQIDTHVGYPILFAQLVRDRRNRGHADYVHAFVADTWRFGRATLTAGVRLDRQAGSVDAAEVGANPVQPLDLPAASVAGRANAIVWTTVAPRVSGSFALSSRTTLHASYGMFATPMASDLAAFLEGLPMQSVALYSVADLNGNFVFDPTDVSSFIGTDIQLSRIGDYATPRAHEVTGGVEREFSDRLTVHAAFTWRRWTDFNWLHLTGVTGNNFTLAGRLSGTQPAVGDFDVPIFRINADAIPDDLTRVFDARPGYRQQYQGVEVGVTRRMARGWTMRVAVAGGSHQEFFDSAAAVPDPTPLLPTDALFSAASPSLDGGVVIRETTGSTDSGTYMMTPRVQVGVTMSGSIRWGIDVGVSYIGRQGHATPYFRSLVPGSADATSESGKNVLLVQDLESLRLPMVHLLDLRLSRPVRLAAVRMRVDVDLFNLLNRATPLVRGYDLRLPTFDRVLETMSPRMIRIGVRYDF